MDLDPIAASFFGVTHACVIDYQAA